MILPQLEPREQLAAKVKSLMEASADKGTPRLLSKVCYWPPGSKKAGRKVSERNICYVLDTSEFSPSPTLDVIVAIANAFSVPAWQLLVDEKQVRLWMVGRLLSTTEVRDSHVERHLPPTPQREKVKSIAQLRRKNAPRRG